MKFSFYFLLLTCTLIGCSIDNFDRPKLTLSGKIVDAQNNQLVESGGANAGSIVKLYEGNSTQPLLFATLPDGRFINSAVFAGNYSYTVEGPFRPVVTTPQPVVINKNSEVEIKVIPYVRLKTSLVEVTGTTAKVKVEFEKVNPQDKLAHLALIWSTYSHPNTFSFAGGKINLENVESSNLTSGEKIYIIENLKPGSKYYVRAGARTNNPGNYYNYSSQLLIQTK